VRCRPGAFYSFLQVGGFFSGCSACGDDGIEDAEVVEESADDILVGALRVMADAGSDRATREQLAARLTGGDEDALRIRMGKAGAGAPRSMRVGGQPVRGWYRRDIEEAMGVTPV